MRRLTLWKLVAEWCERPNYVSVIKRPIKTHCCSLTINVAEIGLISEVIVAHCLKSETSSELVKTLIYFSVQAHLSVLYKTARLYTTRLNFQTPGMTWRNAFANSILVLALFHLCTKKMRRTT